VPDINILNLKELPTEEYPQGRADLRITLTALPRTDSKPLIATSLNGTYEFPYTKRGVYLIELYNGENLYFRDTIDTGPLTADGRLLQEQTPEEAEALFLTAPLPNATPEALNCAQFQNPRTVWYGYVDKPLVEIRFVFRNVCDLTVRTQLIISSGHQPRASSPSDRSQWKPYETLIVQLVLKPGEEREVTRSLRWFRLESTIPTLNVPRTSRAGLSASFVQ